MPTGLGSTQNGVVATFRRQLEEEVVMLTSDAPAKGLEHTFRTREASISLFKGFKPRLSPPKTISLGHPLSFLLKASHCTERNAGSVGAEGQSTRESRTSGLVVRTFPRDREVLVSGIYGKDHFCILPSSHC